MKADDAFDCLLSEKWCLVNIPACLFRSLEHWHPDFVLVQHNLARVLKHVPNGWNVVGVNDAAISLEQHDIVLGIKSSPHFVAAAVLIVIPPQSRGPCDAWCKRLDPSYEAPPHVGSDSCDQL